LESEKQLNSKSIEIEMHEENDKDRKVKSKSLEEGIQKLDKGLQLEKDKLYQNRENLKKKNVT